MNASYYQNKINQLDKEIADLEKKIALESKIEADKTSKIINIQKSINKNTSSSTYNTKMRQIEGFNKDIANAQKKRADFQKKQAEKRSSRAKYAIDLQKELEKENKKNQLVQKRIQEQYEERVNELTKALKKALVPKEPINNIYKENGHEEYDVFISHASEDKTPFVEELVIELEGLFNIEMSKGKTILPIWHNITKQQVMDFSPTLAGRKALTSATMTAEEIADTFVSMLKNKHYDTTNNKKQ